MGLNQWLLRKDNFVPQKTCGYVQRHFWLTQQCGCYWHSVGTGARDAAYILQLTEQLPQQRPIKPHVSVLPRLRNLGLNTSLRKVSDKMPSVHYNNHGRRMRCPD